MALYFHHATTIAFPPTSPVVPLTQLLMPAAILTISLGISLRSSPKFPRCSPACALAAITVPCIPGSLRLADLRVPTTISGNGSPQLPPR